MQEISLPWYFIAIVIFFLVLSIIGYVAKRSTRTGLDFLISGRNLGLALCTVAVAGEWVGWRYPPRVRPSLLLPH